jgi:hypothetical protein
VIESKYVWARVLHTNQIEILEAVDLPWTNGTPGNMPRFFMRMGTEETLEQEQVEVLKEVEGP